jgi:diguanylate cyclase (GGDEF)-like protein
MKILCVEDDPNLAMLLKAALLHQHYQVEVALDGGIGWDLAENFPYDLILLDWMLPTLDGICFCKQLRSRCSPDWVSPNYNTPILLMTALDTAMHKVMGLDAGADDFATKPLHLDELMARIRALLRRTQSTRSPLLSWGELNLDPLSYEVRFRGQPIHLASKEYKILELFLRYPNQILSSSRLLESLWVEDKQPSEGAVRSHIKGLRHKLKQVGVPEIFDTIYKLGYRLKPPPPLAETPLSAQINQSSLGCANLDASSSTVSSSSLTNSSLTNSSETNSSLLGTLWQNYQHGYCDRLAVVRQALIALQTGTLTVLQKRQAQQEAHTLIGSLGSFGLDEASRKCRQLFQWLQQDSLNQNEVEAGIQCVADVQAQMEAYTDQVNAVYPRLPGSVAATVLIVDEDPTLSVQLVVEAIGQGMHPQTALTIDQARQQLAQHLPDVILLDLNVANSPVQGIGFLAELHLNYAHLPVIIFTTQDELTVRIQAARLGCQRFLSKSIAPSQAIAAVAQVLQQANQSAGRLLIVDDDPSFLELMHRLLAPHGYQITLLDQPQQFWQILEQITPDLVILDIVLDNQEPDSALSPINGIDLCQVMRNDPRWTRLPILLLSAAADPETIQRGFAAQADDFLRKPVVVAELLTRIQTRLEQRTLWKQSDVDELTGVSLRRKTLQDLTRLFYLAKRQQQALSIAILDIDHFKQVNDRYGHTMGDRVLAYFGSLLLDSFRTEDVVGRWGGEEFIVGMYSMTKLAAIKRIEQILQRLRQHIFTAIDGTPFCITFSAGIAELTNGGEDWQNLYQQVDIALYQAKSQGRNRIVVV